MKLVLILSLFSFLGLFSFEKTLAKDPPPTTQAQGQPLGGEPQMTGPQGVGEAPLDTCNCPEVEVLSMDVRSILEEAYRNQGVVPHLWPHSRWRPSR
jgi:hypothetical protein